MAYLLKVYVLLAVAVICLTTVGFFASAIIIYGYAAIQRCILWSNSHWRTLHPRIVAPVKAVTHSMGHLTR